MRLGLVVRLLTPRRVVYISVTLVLLYVVWTLFISDDQHERWYEGTAPCKISDQLYEDMTELAFRIHETLDKLNVPHFLCYGTLWGAVRMNAILPWDNNVDMCVLDEDISRVDEGYLYSTFQRSKISIFYERRHGFYDLRYKNALGKLTVFQRFFGQMERVGWEIRLLPFLYKTPEEFPSRLVEKPFPTQKFLGSTFPVPREGIELLKYLYPDNWWKEIKPRGC